MHIHIHMRLHITTLYESEFLHVWMVWLKTLDECFSGLRNIYPRLIKIVANCEDMVGIVWLKKTLGGLFLLGWEILTHGWSIDHIKLWGYDEGGCVGRCDGKTLDNCFFPGGTSYIEDFAVNRIEDNQILVLKLLWPCIVYLHSSLHAVIFRRYSRSSLRC